MRKRMLSLMLIGCMLFTITPTTTYAGEGNVSKEETASDGAALKKEDDAATKADAASEQEAETKKAAEETEKAAADSEKTAAEKKKESADGTAATSENGDTAKAVENVGKDSNKIAVQAAEGEADVTRWQELKQALNDAAVTTINITGNLTGNNCYSDAIDTDKKIVVKSGAALTCSGYKDTFRIAHLSIEEEATFEVKSFSAVTVAGTVENNGTINVPLTSFYACFWTAKVTGSGSFSSTGDTYISYGTVPDDMLKSSGMVLGTNYYINVLADVTRGVSVSLPETMYVGDTITPIFTNVAEGLNLSDVFKFTWKNASSFTLYDGAVSPTLTKSGTLKLSVSVQKGYKMMMSNNSGTGSIDVSGTVQKRYYSVVYVDSKNGNDNNLGNTSTSALKTVNKAIENVTENGTIILLNDCTDYSAIFEKSVTVKSEEGHVYKFAPSYTYITKNETAVNLESLEFSGLSVNVTTGTGNLSFDNCTGKIESTTQNIKDVAVKNSEFSGQITAAGKLTMIDSTITGRIWTQDFEASGKNTFVTQKNSPGRIEGTAKITDPITIQVTPEKGYKVLEVKDANQADILPMLQLSDTQDGLYGMKCSKQYNGTYVIISQRVQSGGNLIVANEPLIGENVEDSYALIRQEDCLVKAAVWSGNSNTGKWSAGDMPELTITLKQASRDGSDGKHFDTTFDAAQIKVYSWKDINQLPDISDETLNHNVKIIVKEGQGLSVDGETYTFTVVYPKVERLSQSIETDLTERSAVCGEKLKARPVTAKGEISYESADPSIAAVDPKTGEVTAVNEGTTKIRIKAAQTDVYNAAEVKYQVTVKHAPVTAPKTVADLIYNGKAQELLTPGETTEGTLQYKIGDGKWQEEIPTAVDAGTYHIFYKAVRPAGHGESEAQELEVKIAPKSMENAEITLKNALKYTGEEQTQQIEKVTVDGLEIPEGAYEVTENTATKAGTYTLTITAKEGSNYTGRVTKTYVIAPTKEGQFEENEDGKLVIGKGTLSVEVKQEGNVPKLGILSDKSELLGNLVDSGYFTAEELTQIADGASVDIVFTIMDISKTISEESRTLLEELAAKEGYTVGKYLDIQAVRYMTVSGVTDQGQLVSELKAPIKMSVELEELQNKTNETKRSFNILRNHTGEATVLKSEYNEKTQILTFATEKFSDYAIGYKDTRRNQSIETDLTERSAIGGKKLEARPVTADNAVKTADSTVKTGDTAAVKEYGFMLGAALAAMGGVLIFRRKRIKK